MAGSATDETAGQAPQRHGSRRGNDMSDKILWFATRGAGTVSLLLFTAVVCLGVLTVMRWQGAGWPRFLSAQLHRNLSLLSLVFLAVHVVTAIADPFAQLGVLAAVVPFASSYRPLWVGLGVIAVDLGIALVVTSLLRARVGQRAWRAIHWLAYACWPLAVLHGIGSGTDAAAPWMLAIDALCVGSVMGAVAWRVLAGRSNRSQLAGIVSGARRLGARPEA
jgi:sulfoxide reductase heme-binding subunit YedZ